MTRLHIGIETVPEEPDFSTEHYKMAQLYADANDEDRNDTDLLVEYYDEIVKSDVLLAARINNRLAGIALYDVHVAPHPSKTTSLLTILAAAPEYRGLGLVGPALLDKTLTVATEKGAPYLDVQCRSNRIPYYQKHQFETVGKSSYGVYRLRRYI